MGEHALEHFRIGKIGQVIPQSECPASGVMEIMPVEQQMGKRCFNTILLGKATRMDVAQTQRFLKADPAGCEKNGGFFFPLILITPTCRWTTELVTERQALEPVLLLVLPYWNRGVCSTHNWISIIFLTFGGSILPASMCPCCRHCHKCSSLAEALLVLARNSRLSFPFCKPLKKHFLAGW